MIDFYYGYIYALIEVYAEIKDLPESEIIFDFLKDILEDFVIDTKKELFVEEAPEGSDLGESSC